MDESVEPPLSNHQVCSTHFPLHHPPKPIGVRQPGVILSVRRVFRHSFADIGVLLGGEMASFVPAGGALGVVLGSAYVGYDLQGLADGVPVHASQRCFLLVGPGASLLLHQLLQLFDLQGIDGIRTRLSSKSTHERI